MQDFDRALKELFQTAGTSLFERLGGASPRSWLNVEFAHTRAPRADLVAWLENDKLFHLEFQSSNDSRMSWRMLDYYAQLCQKYDLPPLQVVLYLGEEPMRMGKGLEHRNLRFEYQTVDIRDFDGDELAGSSMPGDIVLAVLCPTPEPRARIRKILDRLLAFPPEERQRAIRLLLILSGLRGLGEQVSKEVAKMPVVFDFMKDSFMRGLYEKGVDEGRNEGEVRVLRRQLSQRFGPVPSWVDERLSAAREEQLESWADRILAAASLEELFG